MLILSRKVNEQIKLGDSITITVTEICGDKVKLGFEAPEDVDVHRQEVYDAIQKESALRNQYGGEQ